MHFTFSHKQKKDNKFEKWNKEKYTGNQQWREANWESNQWFGAEGKNKHSTRTEWRNKNSKKWGETQEPPGQL